MRYWLIIVGLCLAGCATTTRLPEHLKVAELDELLERIERKSGGPESFVAEARLTWVGDGRRLKGTATLASKRPGFLRYEIQGPHGGVLEAFATNGKEFQVAKLAEGRFLYGPAKALLLNRLLPFAPLSLDSAGWVDLLFGRIAIPPSANWQYDPQIARFVVEFERGAAAMRVEVVPETSRISRITSAIEGESPWEVKISRWDPSGLPAELGFSAPGQGGEGRIKLRDIKVGQHLEDSLFVLEPLEGVISEYRGS